MVLSEFMVRGWLWGCKKAPVLMVLPLKHYEPIHILTLSQLSIIQSNKAACEGGQGEVCWCEYECVWYLHIVEDTPSTVRVSGAQTLPTSGVLLAAFHWNSHHLERERETDRQTDKERETERQGGRERERERGQGGEEIISILVLITLVRGAAYLAWWRWGIWQLITLIQCSQSVCLWMFLTLKES